MTVHFTLYGIVSSASMIPHILLRELQLPHEMIFLDRSFNDHKSEHYLKLNPNGLVPTLVCHGLNSATQPMVLFETNAICLFLAEFFPSLCPSQSDHVKRAKYLQWMSFLSSSIQADSALYFYPHRYIGSDDCENSQPPSQHDVKQFQQKTEKRLFEKFKIFDSELSDGRNFVLGEDFSVVDIYLFVLARWTRHMSLKARELPHLSTYLEKMCKRESIQQVFNVEGIETGPFY